jgi:hypothetical protein
VLRARRSPVLWPIPSTHLHLFGSNAIPILQPPENPTTRRKQPGLVKHRDCDESMNRRQKSGVHPSSTPTTSADPRPAIDAADDSSARFTQPKHVPRRSA